ncbi:hypothetical protein [Achromobacter sp. Bel]|uniref:hypothetical protein n=1 Tax=Achromobacter sp. Bel TaxID=2727415 RepID=UPI00145D5280|nr:hypothetical protein [Achromobacter sp. Bel]NMK45511.1 hypothetical protein [Achromobacter sp. Bel]
MTLSEIIKTGIDPALVLLPAQMDTQAARLMLLAIGLQESRFIHRRQVRGPARGFWQFEKGGGVRGVLTHSASRDHAYGICAARGVEPVATSVYAALEFDDVLAAVFARLLMWTDGWRLPDVGDVQGGWELYIRTWRPGKPHAKTWPALYAQAVAELGGNRASMA